MNLKPSLLITYASFFDKLRHFLCQSACKTGLQWNLCRVSIGLKNWEVRKSYVGNQENSGNYMEKTESWKHLETWNLIKY